MTLIEFFNTTPYGFMLAIGGLGLIAGSFLNVVIHRLPIMLERQWTRDCREHLKLSPPDTDPGPYNLVVPGSACPACGAPVRPWQNIPILSYVILRGRCAACGARISPRYPLVEVLTAVASLAVAWRFGVSLYTAAALLLSWSLVALAMIDLETRLLPDLLTLPLLWLGLLVNLNGTFVDLRSAVIGALSGYLILWLVYHVFKWLTRKEGMGYGDFKLTAMLGAWLGWTALPLIIVLSSLLGALVGIGMILARRHDRNVPIPFGPFLAGAGWIALLWGPQLNRLYLDSMLR